MLGPVERQIAELAAAGGSFETIALRTGMTPQSVIHQLLSIYRVLHIHSREELIHFLITKTGRVAEKPQLHL